MPFNRIRLFDELLPGEKQRALWTSTENCLLLNVIDKLKVIQDICRRGKNREIFKTIQKQLNDQGCSKTWLQIRTKWMTLKRAYVTETKARRSGEPRKLPINPAITTDVYDLMTSVLGKDVEVIEFNSSYRLSAEDNTVDDEVENKEVASPRKCRAYSRDKLVWKEKVDDVDDDDPLELCMTVEEEKKTPKRTYSCLSSRTANARQVARAKRLRVSGSVKLQKTSEKAPESPPILELEVNVEDVTGSKKEKSIYSSDLDDDCIVIEDDESETEDSSNSRSQSISELPTRRDIRPEEWQEQFHKWLKANGTSSPTNS